MGNELIDFAGGIAKVVNAGHCRASRYRPLKTEAEITYTPVLM